MDEVPVLRPQLPTFDAIAPYLREIDASRIYSNHGPLVREFERRIAEALAISSDHFCSASSGTAAIVGAILAVAGRATVERPFAFLPNFTFVGTPVAVEQCGYRPYLVDCDAITWMMTPEMVLAIPDFPRCGVVVVVSPFGRPIVLEPWLAFQERYGVPVVIDGAASFDSISKRPDCIGSIPVALSFHATKAFGIGEGGGVATRVDELARRVTRALNFGFLDTRDSAAVSINGKLSEYEAAVGLAALDGWAAKERACLDVAAMYQEVAQEFSVAEHLCIAPDISCSYILFEASNAAKANALFLALDRARIGCRRWYGTGVAGNAYYADSLRGALTQSSDLASRLIGLPMAPDLSRSSILRIVETVALTG